LLKIKSSKPTFLKFRFSSMLKLLDCAIIRLETLICVSIFSHENSSWVQAELEVSEREEVYTTDDEVKAMLPNDKTQIYI
jgi:hypothetical protein